MARSARNWVSVLCEQSMEGESGDILTQPTQDEYNAIDGAITEWELAIKELDDADADKRGRTVSQLVSALKRKVYGDDCAQGAR